MPNLFTKSAKEAVNPRGKKFSLPGMKKSSNAGLTPGALAALAAPRPSKKVNFNGTL